jgi:type IV pilus assembly protein PilN
MRIKLNLATRPYADIGPAIKRLRIAMAVLVVIGIGLGLGLHAFHQKAEEARATEQLVQKKIDAINRERQGYQELMRQPANAQLLTQVAALNQLFDEKTFSWTLAMEDLETVLPGGVQVISLEPSRDSKTGRITLKLRVVGPRDRGDDLVQNLERSKHFVQPHIVSESSESTGGPNERLEAVSASNRFNFELLTEYNAAVPVDRKTGKKHEEEKPMATGKHAGPSVPSHPPQPLARPVAGKNVRQNPQPPHATQPPAPPAVPVEQPVRPQNNGPGRIRERGSRNPTADSKPGGPR